MEINTKKLIVSDNNNDINKVQKLANSSLKIVLYVVSIIVGIIGILSIFITAYFDTTFYHAAEKTYFKFTLGILEILIAIVGISLILVFCKKILKKLPSQILLAIICIFSFILFIGWINTLMLNPESDQRSINDMAIAFLNGNIDSFTGVSQYLFLYPFQFGITLLVSIIYKIFGENFLYVEYLNAICSIINMILIYNISKLLFKNENIQKVLCFLLGGFSLYWMFFNVHFYGNIIGLTLALVATLFTILYLDKEKIYFLFFSGIFISLSIIIKSNYNIFLCGLIIILILNTIKKWKFKTLIGIAIFIVGYLVINITYNIYFENVTKIDTSETGTPMISYIYMGMSEPTDKSPGWYNDVIVDIYRDSNYDKSVAEEESITLIKERIGYFFSNPLEFFKYYSEKIGSTWLNPTFQTIWCSLPGVRYRWYEEYVNYISYHATALSMVGGNLKLVEEEYFDAYQIVIFIFASVGIFKNIKNLNLKLGLLPIIFLGGFLFHIMWETKAIYVIQYYFLLLPFAACGLEYLYEKIKEIYDLLKKKKKEKIKEN